MKAKEYFDKYKAGLENPDTAFETAKQFYLELKREMYEICKSRNVKTYKGLEGVLKEQNQKANAMINMFDPPVLRQDFFKYVYEKNLEKSENE